MRNNFLVLVCFLLAGGVQTGVAMLAPRLVLENSFETEAERGVWSRAEYASWVPGYKGGTSLKIEVRPAQTAGGNMIRMPLDMSKLRGYRVLFECMARAENVTRPSAPWLGVKFMLHYKSPTYGSSWKNENDVYGSFDWRKLRFTQHVALDAEEGELLLGLQDSSGMVWFDDIRITILDVGIRVRPEPLSNPAPVYKGHDLPGLRGVMSPNVFREEDLRVLGLEWRANVIRWQLTRNWNRFGTDRDLGEYDNWLSGRLDELDKALEACRRYGIKVVVDLHSPPGGRYPDYELAIFHEKEYQEHFVQLWEKIALRYRDNDVIWGYDLINEPTQNLPSPPGVADYLEAQTLAAVAIRKHDPSTAIFVAPSEGGAPEGFRYLDPVDVPGIIYQVHMYVPSEYTHQGVRGEWSPRTYPGTMSGNKWDREALRKTLFPVREFQLAYNVHIYAGEFSAVRWAPGAVEYLRDCIELFEEYGWDWSYHAYREWDGWSVEHGSDAQNHRRAIPENTDRKKLLLEWFEKNEKPLFK